MHNVDCTRRASDRNPKAENSREVHPLPFEAPLYWCRVPRPALAADISDSAFRVLAAIESLANKGHCYATDEEISSATGKSLSAISRALRELAGAGWIIRTNGRRCRDVRFTFAFRGPEAPNSTNKAVNNVEHPGRFRRASSSHPTAPCIKTEREDPKSEAPRSVGPARERPTGPTGETKPGGEPAGEQPLTAEQAIELAKGSCPVLAQFGRAALVKHGWSEPAIAEVVGHVPRGLRPLARQRPPARIGPRQQSPPGAPGPSPSTLAPPPRAHPPSPRAMLNLLSRSMRPGG